MKTLDRHLSLHFLGTLSATALVFLGLFQLVEVLEKLRILVRYHARVTDSIVFFAARVPWMISQVIPMAALMGTLLSVTVLSRHSEITAYRCGGVSVRRLALPYLATGLALSLLTVFLQEIAAPRAAAYAREVMELRIKKRPANSLIRADDLWLKLGPRILHVDRVVPEQDRLVGVSVVEMRGALAARRIDAAEALWTRQGWVLRNVEDRRFDPVGGMQTERRPEMAYPLSDGPSEFRIEQRDVREISWRDLVRQIRRYRSQGIETRDLEVGLWSRTSLPLASLIMPFLAFPFALRSGRKGGASLGIALGAGLGFVYWMGAAVCLSLGKAGSLPAPLAAWAGNLAFGALGAVLLNRAESQG